MSTGPNAQSARRQALLEKMLQKGGSGPAASGITPLPRDTNRFPASYAQQRTWFMDQLNPGTAAFNAPISLRLLGSLDVTAFENSLKYLVARHETLRTHFESIDGVLYQVIESPGNFKMDVADLRDLPEPERAEKAHDLVQAAEHSSFDLSRGPLFTALLVRLSDEDNGFVLNMHHIVADGWSHGIILQELDVCYTAYAVGSLPEIEPLALQYVDIAHWQSTKSYDRDLTYWKETLAAPLPVLDLPLDRPRPPRQTYNGTSLPIQIPFDTVERLKELGQTEGASPFMTMLAAFKVLLVRYSGQTDIIVGSTTTGRTRKEEQGIIGDFVNMLALRTSLAGNPTFRELLQRVRAATTGAYAHQTTPFEKIVESLPPTRSRVFQITFGMNSLSMPDVGVVTTRQIGPLALDMLQEYTSTSSKLDLMIFLWETPTSLSGYVEYNTDIFDRKTMETLAEDYKGLSAQIAANPDKPLADYHLAGIEKRILSEPDPVPATSFKEPTDKIEESLCRIWAESLGLESVGIDDNFFDLGGHSLLAFRLLAKIKQEFDPSISIAETFKAPTIRAMARMIRRKQSGEEEWSPLVPLKSTGTRPPLFCAPVSGGSAFYYRTLATFMDADQPLYALEPIGLNGIDDPHATIEEMAAYYITHIRLVQPHGPYALCGLSMGGTIAFEMARQLTEAGEEIASLMFFDTWAPGFNGRAHGPSPGSLPYVFRNVRYKALSQVAGITGLPSPGDRMLHMGKLSTKVCNRIINRLKGKPWKEAYANPNSIDLPDAYQKLMDAEGQALSNYHPSPYAGQAVLLKAHLDEPDVDSKGLLGWDTLAPNLKTIRTPGTHYTMLEEPCVRTTASHIRNILCKHSSDTSR